MPQSQGESSQIPLVSVIIPTYNHARYIEKCLEGVLMQQVNFPIEILVGEDESNDGTREICIEYQKKYPGRITLFLNDRKNVIYFNGRPTGRWNLIDLVKHSKGKYIAECEGDDYWTDPGKLQKQVDFMEANPDYAICCHNVEVIHSDGNEPSKLYHKTALKDTLTIEDLCKREFIPTVSVLFINVIRELPAWTYKCKYGDWPFFLLVAEHGKIKYLNEVMAVHIIHKGGIWSKLSPIEMHKEKKDLTLLLNKSFHNKYKKQFYEILVPEYISLCKLYRFDNMFLAYWYALRLLTVLKYNKTLISRKGLLKGLFTGKWEVSNQQK